MRFGSPSSLEWIGDFCFSGMKLRGLLVPRSVTHTGIGFFDGTNEIIVQISDGKQITFTYQQTDMIKDLKKKVSAEAGIPTSMYHLSFKGKLLDDHKLVSSYGIPPSGTVRLIRRMMV